MGASRAHALGPPVLLKKIDTAAFGALVTRYGDLDGDKTADVLIAQNIKRDISALTALDLNGKKLWQLGTPEARKPRISADLPVQIFDVDGDGKNEVVTVYKGKLKLLEGKTGKTLQEAPTPPDETIDALYIAQIWEKSEGPAILIKNRYNRFWVYNRKLEQRWSGSKNTGHIPFAFDQDGDGKDELLVGYTLYRGDGSVVWRAPKLPAHNDSTDLGDLDGDGKPELAIASSRNAFLLTLNGEVLWERKLTHAQHAVIGTFDWKAPKLKQVAFVDREAGGKVYCYDRAGKELWQLGPQGERVIESAIDGWTGLKNQSLLLLFRREIGPPVLIDGEGKEVIKFPFDPAWNGEKFKLHYAQHFDALGDGREEVLVNNEKAIWIYGNSTPPPPKMEVSEGLPNRRVYNATFYVGMQ